MQEKEQISPKSMLSGAEPYLRFQKQPEPISLESTSNSNVIARVEERRDIWFETRHVPRKVQAIRSFIHRKFGEKSGPRKRETFSSKDKVM